MPQRRNVGDMDSGDNRLGNYLRARRDLVSPERAGIPAGDRRRVPGLRREEVAMLAGISTDYYLRLERGRDAHPSEQVLSALARVLQLDDVERAYLLDLAHTPTARRRPRREEAVPRRLHTLLSSIGVPAFVEGRAYDVLASNDLARALSPRLTPGENRLRSLLLDPAERDFHTDWERQVRGFVAAFRGSVRGQEDDPRIRELVGELSLASARFRELWARHDVRELVGGTASIHHPVVGGLALHRDKLPVDAVTLVIYYAADEASAEKLALLAASNPATVGGVQRSRA